MKLPSAEVVFDVDFDVFSTFSTTAGSHTNSLLISPTKLTNMADANGEGGAVGKESINTEIVTLTRFLNEEQVKHREATGEFTYVRRTNALD